MKNTGSKVPISRTAGCLCALACVTLSSFLAEPVHAQSTAESLKGVLEELNYPRAITAYQLQTYLAKRIPHLSAMPSATKWQKEETKLRNHILADVVFHGWPREWIDASPDFEQTGVIATGKGYRLRKLRYEIVPRFHSTAILYEPERTAGRSPAILNVIGHENGGNAAEYEQKRCINFAKRGIFALSLSWPGFGELSQAENAHDYAAYLDLAGANALGFFYLSMRRGLDYLASLPKVDGTRLGVTGLSGGGWQTTLLGALDDRVAVAVEVAGIGALESNLVRPIDTDEIEENATDLTQNQDYPWFLAMRAPRPTLLIHNANDDCCFRAALVKPYIYERVRPFFRIFGKPDNLAWHENLDPGTHNYQLENREQAYAFFARHFGLPALTDEIPSDSEIRPAGELASGLPGNDLTILGLARNLAGQVVRPDVPNGTAQPVWTRSQREELREVVRYTPVSIQNVWRTNNTKRLGVESLSARFDFSNGLSATGIWLKAISTPLTAPLTIVLKDEGYRSAGEILSERVNRGEQLLALDLLFNGSTAPESPASWELLVSTTGDRPLGLEAAQLLAIAHWARNEAGQSTTRVVTDGMRNQVIALTAAALEPGSFAVVESRRSIASFNDLLTKGIAFRSAPELFCLDLYKYFDIDLLSLIAAPTEVHPIAAK